MCSAPCKPVSQAAQVYRESSFGGAVEIIAFSTAVPGNRADAYDGTMASFFKVTRYDFQNGSCMGKICVDNFFCFIKVRLCFFLVA